LPRSGSRVRIPSPAPTNISINPALSAEIASVDAAAGSLNKPRTVPRCQPDLGNGWAKRSRKVPEGPPDPEKRSPASAATERGTDRKISKFKKRSKNSKEPESAQQPERHSFALYSGRAALGHIEQTDERFVATVAPNGLLLGTFASLKAAADAIAAMHEGGR
jgi:hypothetical protein